MKVDDGRISCRAFSRRIGVSPEAVSKAIERGRLKESVGRDDDGKPYIKDPDLAEREWNQNRSKSRDLTLVVSKPAVVEAPAPVVGTPLISVAASPLAAAPERPLEIAATDGEQGELDLRPPSLIDSQTQANLERARKLRLENDVTEGRLIPVELANKERFEGQRIVRESILNLPARISGELAVETDPARVQLRLENLLRDALNAAADALVSDEALQALLAVNA